MYGAIGSKTRKISKVYGAISSTTRKIKKVYGVVGGVTKLIFSERGYINSSVIYMNTTKYIKINSLSGNIIGDNLETFRPTVVTSDTALVYGVQCVSRDRTYLAYNLAVSGDYGYQFYKFNGTNYVEYGGIDISSTRYKFGDGTGDNIKATLDYYAISSPIHCQFSDDGQYFGFVAYSRLSDSSDKRAVLYICKNNGSRFVYNNRIILQAGQPLGAFIDYNIDHVTIHVSDSPVKRSYIYGINSDKTTASVLLNNSAEYSYYFRQTEVCSTPDSKYVLYPAIVSATSGTKYQNKSKISYINGSNVTTLYTLEVTEKYHGFTDICCSDSGILYVSEHVEGGSSSSSNDTVCNSIYCIKVNSDSSVTYLGTLTFTMKTTSEITSNNYAGTTTTRYTVEYPQYRLMDLTKDGYGLFDYNTCAYYYDSYSYPGGGSNSDYTYYTINRQGICTLSSDSSGLLTAIGENSSVTDISSIANMKLL